ncbi:hypothetical protein QAD02_020347 [Eretmocerus hayati]|uniref:Uncharacterized protein n=1 Tax=Eretmocerus hayati TaxID=131215 RepID=A0ACC2PRZ6_9HYME|nr:hypothetical protein QAD02_020347 [Eretmocerus hayati]
MLRTDNGTEAVIMGAMQMALRSFHADEMAGEKSYFRGKSTKNQRIECYWRQFKQHLGQFHMDFFKEMENQGVLNIGNAIHIECLRYCFGDLLKDEIRTTVKEWNEHTIRRQNNRNVITGKPNELYHLPENFDAVDCRKTLNVEHAEVLFLDYAEVPQLCDPVFVEFIESQMPGRESPATAEEAFELYQDILEMIEA